MEELNNVSQNTLLGMLEQNPLIKDITEKEFDDKMDLLYSIGCSKTQAINIVTSNSIYLTKTNQEVMELINYLKGIGFNIINILLDSNPYILNLEPYEIDKYIKERISNGDKKEDIIDDLDSNPYLFSEI